MAEKKMTKGDAVRSMSDRELAEFINKLERDAYGSGQEGGYMAFGKKNIDFWVKYFGSPEGEDC